MCCANTIGIDMCVCGGGGERERERELSVKGTGKVLPITAQRGSRGIALLFI
jgi:hypothetical protein